MPSSPSGPWRPIASVTARRRRRPGRRSGCSRGDSSARATPARRGRPTSRARSARRRSRSRGQTAARGRKRPRPPPCAVGSVRGPSVSSSSITEPGQPWVMISGSAFSCSDWTWMKWMSTPSISVVNCGRAFSPPRDRAEVVVGLPVAGEHLQGSSCTPWERSSTSSSSASASRTSGAAGRPAPRPESRLEGRCGLDGPCSLSPCLPPPPPPPPPPLPSPPPRSSGSARSVADRLERRSHLAVNSSGSSQAAKCPPLSASL